MNISERDVSKLRKSIFFSFLFIFKNCILSVNYNSVSLLLFFFSCRNGKYIRLDFFFKAENKNINSVDKNSQTDASFLYTYTNIENVYSTSQIRTRKIHIHNNNNII